MKSNTEIKTVSLSPLNEDEFLSFFKALVQVDAKHIKAESIHRIKDQFIQFAKDPTKSKPIVLISALEVLNKTDKKDQVFDEKMLEISLKIHADLKNHQGQQLKKIIQDLYTDLPTVAKQYSTQPAPSYQPVRMQTGLFVSDPVSIFYGFDGSEATLKAKDAFYAAKKVKLLDIKDLYAAVNHGDLKKVTSYELEKSAINQQNQAGETVLHLAAKTGQLDIFKYLLGLGANPNILSKEERAPIHLFAQQGNVKGMEILLNESNKIKCDINLAGVKGITAAHIAKQEKDVFKLLLNHEANLQALDSEERTPITFLFMTDLVNIEIIKLLRESNIQIDLDELAIKGFNSRNEDVFIFAFDEGANVTNPWNDHKPGVDSLDEEYILHNVCLHGSSRMLDAVLRSIQKRPDAQTILAQKDANGKTAWDYARMRKNKLHGEIAISKLTDAMKPKPSLIAIQLRKRTAAAQLDVQPQKKLKAEIPPDSSTSATSANNASDLDPKKRTPN